MARGIRGRRHVRRAPCARCPRGAERFRAAGRERRASPGGAVTVDGERWAAVVARDAPLPERRAAHGAHRLGAVGRTHMGCRGEQRRSARRTVGHAADACAACAADGGGRPCALRRSADVGRRGLRNHLACGGGRPRRAHRSGGAGRRSAAAPVNRAGRVGGGAPLGVGSRRDTADFAALCLLRAVRHRPWAAEAGHHDCRRHPGWSARGLRAPRRPVARGFVGVDPVRADDGRSAGSGPFA